MSELTWDEHPTLERPLVVVAFRGLFDAASAATAAVEWLRDRYPSERIAAIDPEAFFDFQQERPHVRIDDEGRRRIEWPGNEFHAVHSHTDSRDGGHDLVVCAGHEPHLRWRSFGDHVLEVARTVGAEMVVSLGSMVGMAPHTRTFPVVGSAANRDLAERLGLDQPTYEGPTGLVGVLQERLDRDRVPVISLRVTVPHYVPAPPNPKATRALLARFEQVTGVATGFSRLDALALDWERRVDDAAAEDAEVRGYVSKLERDHDRRAPLPTGDDLAAELEAFLRDQRRDEGPDAGR